MLALLGVCFPRLECVVWRGAASLLPLSSYDGRTGGGPVNKLAAALTARLRAFPAARSRTGGGTLPVSSWVASGEDGAVPCAYLPLRISSPRAAMSPHNSWATSAHVPSLAACTLPCPN